VRPVGRRVGLALGIIALIVAVGALVVRYLSWPHTLVVAAASVSPLVLVGAGVVAVVAFATVRSWAPLGLAVAVLVAGLAVQAPLVLSDDDPPEHPITALTSNIQLGKGDVEQLADLVRSERVDILAVQELTPDAADRIARSTIAADLPNSFVRTGRLAGGTALYSRYPLSAAAALDGFALTNVTAVVDVPGRGDVQVFVVHPVPPTSAGWAEELARIGTAMAAVAPERPVIALGDFNATTDHARYRRLLVDGYRDAGEVAGAGWLPTYPTDKTYPPVVGIDHVVVRGLTAAAVTSHHIAGADHRAVLAEVG